MIAPMTMQPPRAASWAVGAVPFETVSADLDAGLETPIPPCEASADYPREPGTSATPQSANA